MFDYLEYLNEDRDTDRVGLLVCDLLGGGERTRLQPVPPPLRSARCLDAAAMFVLATKKPAPQLRSELVGCAVRTGRGFILVRLGQCPEVSAVTTLDVVLMLGRGPHSLHDLSLYVGSGGEVALLGQNDQPSLVWQGDRFTIINLSVLSRDERADGLRLGSRMIRRAVQPH